MSDILSVDVLLKARDKLIANDNIGRKSYIVPAKVFNEFMERFCLTEEEMNQLGYVRGESILNQEIREK